MHMHRLISPSTFEERVLLRARQKLLLDALVIKKAGEAGAGVALLDGAAAAEGAEGEGGEAAELGKLSVEEMYRMLSHGADAVFDPTADLRPPPTEEEYDAMLDAAKPANVQDDLDEAGAEAAEGKADGKAEGAAEGAAEEGEGAAAGSPEASDPSGASAALDALRAYTCPKVGGLYGSRVHLASDPTALHAIYGKMVETATPCRCEDCCGFVNALDAEAEARGFKRRGNGSYVAGCRERADVVQLLCLVDRSKTLALDDGRSPLDLLRSGSRAAPALLKRECARRGLQIKVDGQTFDLFRCLVEGMHAAAISSASAAAMQREAEEAKPEEAEEQEAEEEEAEEEVVEVEEWVPPPSTRDHADLVAATKTRLAVQGISQRGLGERIGVSQEAVSAWLGSRSALSPVSIAQTDARIEAYLIDPAGVAARNGCAAERLPRRVPALEVPLTTRSRADLVAEVVTHLRTHAMTKKGLALRIGVPLPYVGMWLAGKLSAGPCGEFEGRMAAYLHDPPAWVAIVAAHAASQGAAAQEAAAFEAAAQEAHGREAGVLEAPSAAKRAKRSVAPADRYAPPESLRVDKKRIALCHDVSARHSEAD